mmetsp:Transcript_74493/g.216002  ORF Transcript_74493/g.216002 Transcript_74493/m.216002 type:complete len:797 (-) Transcript_74493:292-2682(-)
MTVGMAPCEQHERESSSPGKRESDTIEAQNAESRSAGESVKEDGTEAIGDTDSEVSEESDDQERRRTVLRRVADALLVVCGAACGGCVVAAQGCADVTANSCFPTDPAAQVAVTAANGLGSSTNSTAQSDTNGEKEEDTKALGCAVNDATDPPPDLSAPAPIEAEPVTQAIVKPVAEAPPTGAASLVLRQRQLELKDRCRVIASDRSGFVPGATLEVLHATIMREGQSLKSPKICEFESGERLLILDLGVGRRLKVEALSTGQVGWVSRSAQRANRRLLALKYPSPGAAVGPGAVLAVGADHMIMRKCMDLESEKICDCPPNGRLRVIEEPAGRRVKVERIDTGEVGWVSTAGENRKRYVKLVQEMPWRREGFAIGAQIESLRTVIVRAEEATSSKMIAEYDVGEEFVVFELGAGCRMRVRHLSGTMGWVSSASAHGGFLFSVKRESLVPGQSVETTSDVIVREGVDLASPEITEVGAGAKAVVLEPPEGRRVKVRLSSSGAIGWVSVLTQKGQLLLRPDTAPAASAPGALQAVSEKAAPRECPDKVPVVLARAAPQADSKQEAPEECSGKKALAPIAPQAESKKEAPRECPHNAPVASAPAAPQAVSKEDSSSECGSQGTSVHTPIKQYSAPPSTIQEVDESDEEDTKVHTSASRRIAENVVPACSAMAAVLGGAVLLVGSAVGVVIAAPFYGCYLGAQDCATCGSAVCRRCRSQATVASAGQEQSAASMLERRELCMERAMQGAIGPSGSVKDGTKVMDRAAAEDLSKIMRMAGHMKPFSGCYLCLFTTMSLKE